VVKVVFASCSEDLVEHLIDEVEKVFPSLPTVVVSEFQPKRGVEWIPYRISWTLEENEQLLRSKLNGRPIAEAAIALQPNMPYWPMRRMGLRAKGYGLLVFNENLNHFSLRPSSAPAMIRHMIWRTGNLIRWQLRPGGKTYTWLWRISHPVDGFRRPVLYRLAQWAGKFRAFPAPCELTALEKPLPEGITVVIPSRNGRELLAECLPLVVEQHPSEVIVVDNGSDDGTADWIRAHYPSCIVIESRAPLSFARAVNRGIAQARYSHVCLLNNDMLIETGFFYELRRAFDCVPDLFSSTAQIFFPQGQRREETGKAVMLPREHPSDFLPHCVEPLPGEDHSYVLYGSGGCSLYDTRRLRQLGAIGEVFEPAYVEDLDIGFRGWRQGWPSVYVAGARVLHKHRATTSRYLTEDQLKFALEVNFLRFLVRSVTDRVLFARMWFEAIYRINWYACENPPYMPILKAAQQAGDWVEPQPAAVIPEHEILSLNNGRVAVFPGRDRRHGRPCVLIASCYLPFPLSHGGAVRMYNLMRRAALDFDQVLVAFSTKLEAVPQELLDICAEVVVVQAMGSHDQALTGRPQVVEEFDRPEFHAALRQTIRKHEPSIVQLEFTQLAAYAQDCAPAKSVLVEHDITLDLYAQLRKTSKDWEIEREHSKWVAFEQEAWREVDCVITMSEKDKQMVTGARRVEPLINGVDLDRFRPAQQDETEPGRLLFIGSFAHLPNVLALDWFLREVWPRIQDVKPLLHIIAGRNPEVYLERYKDHAKPDLSQPGILLESFVSDVRPAYRKASVVVAPLLASAGTNIKIMEAMAMGKAIVTTPGGINGLELEEGKVVRVAKTGEEMAAEILDLTRHVMKRINLERAARHAAERDFDWDVIARRQADIYRSLL
jgi:GT2 family glycosyltransferase/glycosyltransferase involved in cell wall biosynthesis